MIWKYVTLQHEISWIPRVLDTYECKLLDHEIIKFQRENENFKENVDFLWTHKFTKCHQTLIANTKVHGGNAVCGSNILENKFNLALLQYGQSNLESYALENYFQLYKCCERIMTMQQSNFNSKDKNQYWIIKEAGANCGDGLYIITIDSWKSVLKTVQEQSSPHSKFVLQKYIQNPLLWDGKSKFHLRIYLILTGDGGLFMFPQCLAHVANKDFSLDTENLNDPQIHLSNVTKNYKDAKAFRGCPVITLQEFLPSQSWDKLIASFKELKHQFQPFMEHQHNRHSLSHIGADVMLDENFTPYLLECNIPPGIGNHGALLLQNQDDLMIEMFSSMIDTFVIPALIDRPFIRQTHTDWVCITPRSEAFTVSKSTGFNNMAWKIYEKRALELQKKELNNM